MKIKLPKTLAEPLTIPWMLISSSDVTECDIDDALHNLIDNYERKNLMPEASSSTTGICTMLRITAEVAGTDNVDALAYPIVEHAKHTGYEYVVLYSLPNSKNLYNWSRKSWFPWFPSTMPNRKR
jgi:hypothetical protein